MKPAAFTYIRPGSVEEAVAGLSTHQGEARLLAGGQSLVPMMNFRLIEPSVCIDINHVAGLGYVEPAGQAGLKLGALARHYTLETSPVVYERFPALSAAVTHVGHLAVRNRGTLGGSLSHADPAAELPAMTLLLDGVITASGPSGAREIPAGEFFLAPLVTALEETEMITSVYLPGLPPGAGWGFREISLRRGDFAVAGAAAILVMQDGTVTEARIALFGVDETPVRATGAEKLLAANRPDRELLSEAATSARDAVTPMNDLHGSADFRRHLTEVLTMQTLTAAAQMTGSAVL